MRRSWRLARHIIVRRVDLEEGEAHHAVRADFVIDEWLRDPARRGIVWEMVRNTSAGSRLAGIGLAFVGRHDPLRAPALEAFRRRELVAILRPGAPSSQGDEPDKPRGDDPPAPPPPPTKKTWIEIVLRDQRGKPVKSARYRLKITDGSTREGRTDENGSVRVSGIDPGQCQITFLDYDKKEWRRL